MQFRLNLYVRSELCLVFLKFILICIKCTTIRQFSELITVFYNLKLDMLILQTLQSLRLETPICLTLVKRYLVSFYSKKKDRPRAVLKVVFELQLHQSFKLCHNCVFSGQTQAHIGNFPILKIYESGNV